MFKAQSQLHAPPAVAFSNLQLKLTKPSIISVKHNFSCTKL